MRNGRTQYFLKAGICLLVLACGGSAKEEGASLGPPDLPNCPATTGTCTLFWSGATSGTLPSCAADVILGTPYSWANLHLWNPREPGPDVWIEFLNPPTPGSGDLAGQTGSAMIQVVSGAAVWACIRQDDPSVTTDGAFALFIESVSGMELHGHLSAVLENMSGAPGTFIQLCATF